MARLSLEPCDPKVTQTVELDLIVTWRSWNPDYDWPAVSEFSTLSHLLSTVSTAEKLTDRDLVNSILDVEDLVRFGNKQRFDVLPSNLRTVYTLHPPTNEV